MKFHFKMEMITNRRLLIITLILFLIIIVGYATSVILLLSSSSDHVDALITVDNKNSRLGESIVFDGSNSTGDINRYFWDLGDGNTSTEEIVVHQYELAGWYNVSLKVESSNGRSSNNSIVVGVQQNDNEVYLDLPRLFWISGGRRGYYVESPLGPNIGNPTAEVNIHLEGAVGNLGISLWFNEEGYSREYYSETFTATGGAFDYSYTFQPFDFPIDAQSGTCEILFALWIDEGKWRSGSIGMNVVFPIENVAP
jgi:hypothetical protein